MTVSLTQKAVAFLPGSRGLQGCIWQGIYVGVPYDTEEDLAPRQTNFHAGFLKQREECNRRATRLRKNRRDLSGATNIFVQLLSAQEKSVWESHHRGVLACVFCSSISVPNLVSILVIPG